MKIALDFDRTYNSDYKLWDFFIEKSLLRDHEIMIVTFRSEDCPIDYNRFGLEVFYTSGTPKKRFMDELGIPIDIWIDDDPSIIVNESEWTKEDRERWRKANGF